MPTGSAGALLLADRYLDPTDRHVLGAILFFGGLLILIAGPLARRDH
jgi:hypothetical protein